MKLVKGQRWKCNNPDCLVEIIENISNSSGSLRVKILILQSASSLYPPGTTTTFCGFPTTEDSDSNYLWQYLRGQDKPSDVNQ